MDRRLDRASVERAHDVLYESDAWTKATWLGAQALKNPLDLWVYQEIMAETQPELIVETGTYRGGSALFLASMCDLLDSGEVVSIDIEPLRDDYPQHPRITYLGGRSSTDPDVVAEVRERAAGAGRSSSSTPTTRRGTSRPSSRSTHRSCRSAAISSSRTRTSAGSARTSCRGRSRPSRRSSRADAFEIDREREKFLITFNPSGYLRRVRSCSLSVRTSSFVAAPTTRTGLGLPEHEIRGRAGATRRPRARCPAG